MAVYKDLDAAQQALDNTVMIGDKPISPAQRREFQSELDDRKKEFEKSGSVFQKREADQLQASIDQLATAHEAADDWADTLESRVSSRQMTADEIDSALVEVGRLRALNDRADKLYDRATSWRDDFDPVKLQTKLIATQDDLFSEIRRGRRHPLEFSW
jgi:flagellar motor switch protein FliM